MNKKVALVIPFYNAEKYLNACVESIRRQTYSYWFIVLVNDGSSDNSLQLAKQYALQDERIVIIDKENGGQSSARNAALAFLMQELEMFSEGVVENFKIFSPKDENPLKIKHIYQNAQFDLKDIAYIQFIDGDDILVEDCVSDCIDRMMGADVLWFDYKISSELRFKKIPLSQMQIFSYEKEGFITREEWFERAKEKPLFWFTWQGMIDFDFLKKIKLKFINGIIYEDHCFGILLFSVAEKIYLYPKQKYCYNIHQDSTMNPTDKILPHTYFYDTLKNCGDFESFKDYQWAKCWVLSTVYMMDYFKKHSYIDKKIKDYFLKVFLDKTLSILFIEKDPLNLKKMLERFEPYFEKYSLSQAECVRQSLTYCLGFAFLNKCKNFKTLITMPWILWKVYRRCLRTHKIFQKNLLLYPQIHFEKDENNSEVRKIKRHLSYKIGRILYPFGST